MSDDLKALKTELAESFSQLSARINLNDAVSNGIAEHGFQQDQARRYDELLKSNPEAHHILKAHGALL
jgi:hypothetical protein